MNWRGFIYPRISNNGMIVFVGTKSYVKEDVVGYNNIIQWLIKD